MDPRTSNDPAPVPGSGQAATDRIDRLVTRTDLLGAPVCVGLDPVWERLPLSLRQRETDPCAAIERFCDGVIEAVAELVPAVKVQSACFERYGSIGFGVLERVIDRARLAGLWTVLDAKRGDIGLSASHYAAGARAMGADAITANPYPGVGTLEPFLEAGLVVFALVRTSNPEGEGIQRARVHVADPPIESGATGTPSRSPGTSDTGSATDAGTVAELIAAALAELGRSWMGRCGVSAVGAVVGATHPSEGRSLRERMPEQPILIPGFGAQGGRLEGVKTLLRSARNGPKGVLVTASRSVIYPSSDPSDRPGTTEKDWSAPITEAARRMVADVAEGLR